jgi:hypothetical protein
MRFCEAHPEKLQWADSCLVCKPILFHTWDGGKTYNAGGFDGDSILWLHEQISGLSNPKIAAETGAGNSTLVFLLNGLDTTSICDDSGVIKDLLFFLEEKSPELLANWHPVHGNSLELLPNLVLPSIDIALIDGGHGFPVPHVDFAMFCKNLVMHGKVIVDDIQLPSPRLLASNLHNIDDYWFALCEHSPNRKSMSFVKNSDFKFLPDWGGNPSDRDFVMDAIEACRYVLKKENYITQ